MVDVGPLVQRLREDPTETDWWVYSDWLAEQADPWSAVVAAGVGGQTDLTEWLEGPDHDRRFGPARARFHRSNGAKMSWTLSGPYVSHGRGELDADVRAARTAFRFLQTSWPNRAIRREQLPPALGGLSFWSWENVDLAALHGLELHSLTLSNYSRDAATSLTRIGRVGPLARLGLRLPVASLEPLVDLPTLRHLSLEDRAAVSVAPLASVPGLRHLSLVGPSGLDALPTVGTLALRGLALFRAFGVDLSVFEGLTDLRRLDVDASSISLVAHFPALETVRQYQTPTSDLTHLAACPDLRDLTVLHCPLATLDGLRDLPRLTRLSIESSRVLADLDPFQHLANLESLELRRCRAITDLGPLAGLRRLRRLVLEHVGNRRLDLSPLFELPCLESVRIVGCRGVPALLTFDDFDRHRPLRYRRR